MQYANQHFSQLLHKAAKNRPNWPNFFVLRLLHILFVILLIKLFNLGVNGFMLNFITAFLTNRSFQFRVSAAHS